MKNIINNIKAWLHIKHSPMGIVQCNYENDYYGDQVCHCNQIRNQ